jgi:hypothetical protein
MILIVTVFCQNRPPAISRPAELPASQSQCDAPYYRTHSIRTRKSPRHWSNHRPSKNGTRCGMLPSARKRTGRNHISLCNLARAIAREQFSKATAARASANRQRKSGGAESESWQPRGEMARPGIFRFLRRKKMNAQCLSPVGRWAFYTVFCTALCGTLTQGNASCLAAVRSWLGLADGIVARTAPRGKGQHGTNRDIKGILTVN